MISPEDHLRAARLAAPSSKLDRRMQAVFAAAAQPPPTRRAVPAWRWAGMLAAAGAAAAVAIWFGQRPAGPGMAPATYNINQQAVLRAWLLNPPADRRPPARFNVRVSTS